MRLDWRAASSYLAVIIGEACWLYILMSLLNGKVADGSISIFGFMLFFVIALLSNKLLQRAPWHPFFHGILSWAAWTVATLLWVKLQFFGGTAFTDSAWLLAIPQAIAQVFNVFRPELLVLLCSILIWWLARRLARVRLSFGLSVGDFQFGLIMLVLSFLLASAWQVGIAGAVPVCFVFFAVSLAGIYVARAGEDRASASHLSQGQWPGLLIISIVLVLIIGFLIGLAVTPGLLQTVVFAVQWVVGEVWKAVLWLTSLIPVPAPPASPPPRGLELPQPTAGEPLAVLWAIPEPVRSVLSTIWGIVFVGLIIVALWRVSTQIFDWFRRRSRATAGVEYERVPGPSFNDLIDWLRHIARALLNLLLPSRFARQGHTRPETDSVRQVYRNVLRWAASKGQPRRLSQTPTEYLPVLVSMLPGKQAELELITAQYTESRYGHALPGSDMLDRMKQAWLEIRRGRVRIRTDKLPDRGKGA